MTTPSAATKIARMNKTILIVVASVALLANAAAVEFKAVPEWLKLP